MKESRGGKYGRNLALWIDFTINQIPECQRENYRSRFIKELKEYSLIPRKEGAPVNAGCVHELSDLVDVDINNPEQFAKLVKESIHLMYQKQTSKRVLKGLYEGLNVN